MGWGSAQVADAQCGSTDRSGAKQEQAHPDGVDQDAHTAAQDHQDHATQDGQRHGVAVVAGVPERNGQPQQEAANHAGDVRLQTGSNPSCTHKYLFRYSFSGG